MVRKMTIMKEIINVRIGEKMNLNEFKDKLFDILNETELLPIVDIELMD